MTSVFLSYDREDTDRARPIAVALEKAGHSVWWDRHIKSGAQFSQEIDDALKRAEAVVVLWSEESIDSPWVRDEAAAGRDSGKLVPVRISAIDPPLGFRQYQTTDLISWKGRVRSAEFRELLEAVESLSGKEPSVVAAKPARISALADNDWARRWLNPWLIIGLAILILGLMISRPWERQASIPAVTVVPSDQGAKSQAIAGNLLVQLGSLQSANADALQLVEPQAGAKPDMTFKVGAAGEASALRASLSLIDNRGGALLWSREFVQPGGNESDLLQQLAYTAAKVLECAVDALSSEGTRMPQATLKLYLSGCSAFAETAAADPRPLIPIFRAVVEQAPRFEGAWAKLLHVESEVATNSELERHADKITQQLRNHIAEARKLNPDMAEIYLAEADLSPPTAFGQRMQLLERAVERNPDSPEALSAHSSYLMKVGRNFEAFDQAKRATQLDPLSPFTRDMLISALTYAGNIDEALEELRKAEQLWPGASNLLGARYRIHLRYGDPQEALRIQRMGDYGGPHRDAFLKARIDPTPANIEAAISYPRRWLKNSPGAISELAQVLGAFGREEDLFQLLLTWRHADHVDTVIAVLFRPALRNFRRDPRMIAVSKQLGLLDYWRTSGKWPDFCNEPDLPYDCKAEAAKLAP